MSKLLSEPKVAIVHDWLYGGGAELVVQELHILFPDAPIYTSYCSDEWRTKLDHKVVTGYLQWWPLARLRKFLPVLRQHWFRRLDLDDFDVVISSSGNGEARFVQVKKPAIHISYCHSPTHFYWSKYNEYVKNPSFRPKWLARLGLKLLVKPLRKRDYQAAQKVDFFVANSTHIQQDIKHFYGRESTVIFPPVDVAKFSNQLTSKKAKLRDGFVVWGRHVPYKRFDLAIEACNKLGFPLTVIGSGPETANLKKIAGPAITFKGWVSSAELLEIATSAKAFLLPGEDDFGIAPVEALAAGTPVIAYKAGGALDFVTEDKTGIFFQEQTPAALEQTIRSFETKTFDPKIVSEYTQQFSPDIFRKNMMNFITKNVN